MPKFFKILTVSLLGFSFSAQAFAADDKPYKNRFEAELGYSASSVNISDHDDLHNDGATKDWDPSKKPLARAEFWHYRGKLGFGTIAQSIFGSSKGDFREEFATPNFVFAKGTRASQKYRSYMARETVNYLVTSSENGSYLRLGGSLSFDYRSIVLEDDQKLKYFKQTGVYITPTFNIESEIKLSDKISFFLRIDTLPASFNDTLLAIRMKNCERFKVKSIDLGLRSYGGQIGDDRKDGKYIYANNFSTIAFVVRATI